MVSFNAARDALAPEEADRLVELFHENTKLSPASFRPLQHAPSPAAFRRMMEGYKVYRWAPKVPLPAAPPPRAALADVLAQRRSARAFRDEPLDLAALGSLLHAAVGITRTEAIAPPGEEPFPQHLRAAPSGGALYPLELYVAALAVRDLPAGVYHLNVRDRALEQVARAEPAPLRARVRSILCEAEMARSCAAVVFFSAVFRRTLSKYGSRGYRYTLIEAGHVAQNLCLAATALGLGACATCGYMDDPAHRLLELDGITEAVLYSAVIGLPATAGGGDGD